MSAFSTFPRFLPLALAAALAGCGKPVPTQPTTFSVPVPTPSPGPPARRVASEGFRVEEAMALADVSFLLRTSTAEAEILQEIATRGLVRAIPAADAQGLAVHGASPRLIAALQDPQYVLSPEERRQLEERKQRRSTAGLGRQQADRARAAEEFAERRRQAELQGATYSLLAEKEAAEREREEARREYERRRAYLSEEKMRLQAQMNQYRQWGYTETQLADQQRQLRKVEADLAALKAP